MGYIMEVLEQMEAWPSFYVHLQMIECPESDDAVNFVMSGHSVYLINPLPSI